jgi:chromosomal replication initiator protein
MSFAPGAVPDSGSPVSQGPAALWHKVLEHLKNQVPTDAFETWLAPTRGVELQNDLLLVEVPNSFFLDWLGQYYVSAIEDASRSALGNGLKIAFRTGNGPAQPVVAAQRKRTAAAENTRLRDRYTFQSYIVAECNNFACAAARAVAESPGDKYNPLLIYGGVGLGKTHLLQAIGNHLLQARPGFKVYYTPAESLFTELITAIESGSTMDFKHKYRSQDLLLLDDVHYLVGKESLQEEIFHLFNHLHSQGKQIVFTSDRPVREIPTLQERLSSRLASGLVVDLQPPDLETRVAILTRNAAAEGFELPQEVALYIATKITSNIRALEGCLIRIIALASMNGYKLTVELAAKALKDLLPQQPSINRETIISQVAACYSVTPAEIKGRVRTQRITLARQVTMYLYRNLLELSLKEIGGHIGGKDHTTVMHSLSKIGDLRKTDSDFDERIKQLIVGITG